MTPSHALIVGGSRGLGRAFAGQARAAGWRVSVVARHGPDPSPDIASDAFYAVDVSCGEAVRTLLPRVVAERGPLGQLVFFQRYRGGGDDWEGEMATSLRAARVLLEGCPAAFAPERPGAVVLVSSVNAQFISPKLPSSYHVAKAGLCQLARYYAVRLGERGIRVNAVCPGTFIKPENERYYAEHPEVYARLAEASPLNRMGTWREMAEAIFFLLSERASFITGQSLVVDGGTSLRWHESLLGL
jgi:NAD(P)-dependent dehydrogenase (short-subunit alcohol dehydrogenase family)